MTLADEFETQGILEEEAITKVREYLEGHEHEGIRVEVTSRDIREGTVNLRVRWCNARGYYDKGVEVYYQRGEDLTFRSFSLLGSLRGERLESPAHLVSAIKIARM